MGPQDEASGASTLGTRLAAHELAHPASACETGAWELPDGPGAGGGVPGRGLRCTAMPAGVPAAGPGACVLAGMGAGKQTSLVRCAFSWLGDGGVARALGLPQRASDGQHASRIPPRYLDRV